LYNGNLKCVEGAHSRSEILEFFYDDTEMVRYNRWDSKHSCSKYSSHVVAEQLFSCITMRMSTQSVYTIIHSSNPNSVAQRTKHNVGSRALRSTAIIGANHFHSIRYTNNFFSPLLWMHALCELNTSADTIFSELISVTLYH